MDHWMAATTQTLAEEDSIDAAASASEAREDAARAKAKRQEVDHYCFIILTRSTKTTGKKTHTK
jgi:hypothetical protein